MKTLQIANFFLLMLSLAACGPAAAPPGLSLEDGWVRAMAPGMTMTAAYGRFVNNGPERIEIREFGSDSFEDVSLHEAPRRENPRPGQGRETGKIYRAPRGGSTTKHARNEALGVAVTIA